MSEPQRDRRHDVLGFLERYWAGNGYAPTFDEIREATGLSSRSHVLYYLGILERDGLVERRPRSPRGVRPTSVPDPTTVAELPHKAGQKPAGAGR